MLLPCLFFIVFIQCVISVPTRIQKRSLDEVCAETHVSDVRLPRDVTPTSYHLEIQPFLDEAEFQGHVIMDISCQDDTDRITLHANALLEITENEVSVMLLPDAGASTTTTTEIPVAPVPVGAARLLPFSSSFVPENGCTGTACPGSENTGSEKSSKLGDNEEGKGDKTIGTDSSGSMMKISKIERQFAKQWLIIYLENRLKRGKQYRLEITFTGDLSTESKEGIYMEQYVDADGQKKSYVATQMRLSNARKVFPCFDEPSYKVPVGLTVATKEPYTVISNTLLDYSDKREEWIWFHFQCTPPISTHSIAFIVSEFSPHLHDVNNSISIITRKELQESPGPSKALEYSVQVTKELQAYFDMPSPVLKLDIIALPGYNNPADSCWGLIIIKESHLTCDNCLLQLISREIVQQWIGNFVTPHWWDGVSVTKALVNFIAFIIEQKLDPTISSSSRLWITHYPLYYELSKWSPMNTPSATKVELVIRMLNYTLSASTLQKAMRQLLNERMYKTFTQDDIWSVLTEHAGLDDTLPEPSTVSQIATSWLSKHRLPYVKITRDYEKQLAEVEQHVFIRDLEDSEKEELLWWIPLVVISQNNLTFASTKPSLWMKEERRVVLNSLPSSTYFIIVNPEEIGPFLVNYDRKNWFLISEYLDRNINNLQIPPGTRAKIVHDALNLAMGGKLRFESALNVTRFLIHERAPIVWNAALNLFDHILRQLDGTKTATKFQEYIKVILAPVYLEWEKRSDELSATEERLLTASKAAMCNAGFELCVQESRRAWKSWMESDDPDAGIPIQQSHFCWVFKHGTPEEWEFGHQRFLHFPASHKQSDRIYLLKTLVSCPNNSAQIEKLLNDTLLGPNSTNSDYFARILLGSLTSNVGYNALFKILSNNFEELKDRYYATEGRMWDNIVSTATRHFKTQEGLDKVSKFYLANQGQFFAAEKVIDQSLQQVKKEVKWMDENQMYIDQWLDGYLFRTKNV